MKTFLLLLFTSLLFSCNKHTVVDPDYLSMTLEPMFSVAEQDAQAAQKQSRATATAFAPMDEIGVYGVLDGQALSPSGNVLTNHKFVAQTDGSIKGSPTAALYPDAKSAVRLSAYYPYRASVPDATKLKFAIQATQSTAAALTSSDLCYASGVVLPSAAAQPLHFEHKLSRVVFNVTVPSALTVTSLRVIDAMTEVSLDLSSGTLAPTTTRGDLSSTSNNFIVPAQTFAAQQAMLAVTVSDGRVFHYTPLADVTLQQGTITTFDLKLNDNHTASLSAPPVIEKWTAGTTSGGISQGVQNAFTAHWLLPSPAYASITSVKLTVYNLQTKSHADYPCTAFSVITDQGPDLFSFSFSFSPSTPNLLGYPYRIDTVKFYNSSSALVEECPSLISASVYKSGAYTLGIKQDNILAIASGTVTDWGELDMTGNIEGGGVNNSFRLQMIDATYAYQSISSVALVIGGTRYTFKGLSLLDGSTQFLATSSTFGFPDFTGQIPESYPYTISSVELYDSSNKLLESKLATIDIGRGGMVSLQCYRGGVIAIGGTATSWGEDSGSGVIIGTGTKNKFTLSLLDTSYPLSAVKSVRFVSGDKEYLFNGITLAAGSNEFLATTSSFTTPDSKGAFPSRYPFVIDRLDVLDASGLVLQSSVGSVEVYDTRDVALRIFKSNLALNYVSSVGDWASDASSGDVNFGGALASNPVTLYYSDSKATNALPCTSATKMSLTIGGKVVSLPIEMVGNGSSASIKTAVNISGATPAANLPARYPYSITKIKLENASNVSLIEQTFTTPIEVGGSGAITIRVAR